MEPQGASNANLVHQVLQRANIFNLRSMSSLRKKFLVFAVISLFFTTTSVAIAEEISKESTSVLPIPQKNEYRITFNQTADGWLGDRYSFQVRESKPNDVTHILPYHLSLLPACTSAKDITCIESVESKRVDEKKWNLGSLSKNQLDPKRIKYGTYPSFVEYGTWKADESSGLAAGGVASSWDFPQIPHANGSSYLAAVSFVSPLLSPFDGLDPYYNFSINIQPWNWACIEKNSCNYAGMAYGESGQSFPPDTEFRITIRLNFLKNRIGTWAVGRLEQPSISTTGSRLIVSGKPVVYPLAYTILKSIDDCVTKADKVFKTYFPLATSVCNIGNGFDTNSNDAVALPLFDALNDEVVQYGQMARWTFSSTKISSTSSPCFGTGSYSLVSSNAMLYSTEPPKWDKSEEALSYRIASTHTDTKGNLNTGNYSLAIPKKVADCLWKFDVQSGRAIISIINPDGAQNIAVSAMRITKDWVYFDASGFTFSAPEIKVSIVKSKPTPSLKTIKCIKGKVLKTINGTNPVCPIGYKIKK